CDENNENGQVTHCKLPSLCVCDSGGRSKGFDDPLERNLCSFGGLSYCGRRSLELAEDDFVLAHQDRAEIADVQPGPREVCDALARSAIESVEIVRDHTRPEALCNEVRVLALDHAAKVRAHAAARKTGFPYEISFRARGYRLTCCAGPTFHEDRERLSTRRSKNLPPRPCGPVRGGQDDY
ncbi:MAG: hypothetical protein QOH23_841, partial [Gaiellaceae bacterium]|nr:hypothetical protein [Gaiellaceae bacterium]